LGLQPVLEPHAKIQHHDIEVNYIEEDDVTQDVTQGESQDESQGGIQDVLQDGELDDWIEKQIKKNPKITAKELALLSQKGLSTIRRRIAKLPHIQYVGSGYSGQWIIKK